MTQKPDKNSTGGVKAADGGAVPSVKKESPTDVLRRLESSADGLTDEQVRARIEEYGYNELVEKKKSAFVKLLGYFWGPIPWMIEAAAILSAVVRHWTDLIIISTLLVLNAVVGFWEEYHADNAIEALKKKLALRARVKRGGKWIDVAARELVPGDVLRLRLGDIIPADAVLLAGDPVEVDQSALTGESLPVERESGQTVYSGSVLRQGEIDAVVDTTGSQTFFGKTAGLVESTVTRSHFQKAVLKIGDYLIVVAVVLVALILVTALFRGDPILDAVRFALVLTVAAIPVAMPTVLSVTMAVGARLLSTRQAIVRRLAAVEEIAGIDVLCSDKTGTLTRNQLTAGAPFLLQGVKKEDLLLAAALASRSEDQDAIDGAVLTAAGDLPELKASKVTHFTPFDPVHKRTEAAVELGDGETIRVTKGAPQMILGLAANKGEVGDAVNKAVDEFARRGYRSLGVARADADGGEWRMLGIVPLYDPPRDDSRETIENAERMGVRVKMVTGDQVSIAREISSQLGLGQNILSAERFGDTRHHEGAELADAIEQADGFAEVFPEHKYHIVDVLQQRRHIVGMTGDGVNDAPALKKADAGIAVSGATDAARAAADIVLTAPGLSTIVEALKESRRIFQRMQSYATYRIAETIRVLLFMTLSILVFNFYPVTAVMIVLLALLNDGAILSIAYDRTQGSARPEAWNMKVVLGLATALGLMGVVETFGLFYLAEHVHEVAAWFHWPWLSQHVFPLTRPEIQTLIYLKLSVAGHLTIFVTRTRGPFWSTRPSSILLWAVVCTQLIATAIAIWGPLGLMTPLHWQWAVAVWGYALVWFLIEDRVKLATYSIMDMAAPGLLEHRHIRKAHRDKERKRVKAER